MSLNNPLLERILAQEAPGGRATRLSIVAPSIVEVGEPFSVRLAALDSLGYPSVECGDAASPLDAAAFGLPDRVVFEPGRPAAHLIDAGVLRDAGIQRLAFEFDGQTFLSNPIMGLRQARDRLWWGDPHVHTILSRCNWQRCRSLNFCFVCARYVSALDWVCAADHVSNGRSDASKWKAQRVAARLFDDPPHFAALLGYEASLKGGAGGDNNVYFADDAEAWVDEYEDGDTRTLWDKLGDQDFFIVPHHTTRPGKHGELNDRTYLGPERMPVVEIHSKWGTSEYSGNPNALHDLHPGPSYVQDLLARGYRLGFIAGTDTHATMPSGFGEDSSHIDRLPGFTAVYSPELSRSGVYRNIRGRRCYAASLERILIDTRIADQFMGTEHAWADPRAPRRVRALIAAESNVEQVDVVRNGQDVHTHRAAHWQTELDWCDEDDLSSVALGPTPTLPRPFAYYYLRVTCASGAQAWTSPVWLSL